MLEETEQHFYDITQNSITEINFYDGAQNRTQLHFVESSNKQRSTKPQNSPRNRLTKIFTQHLTRIHYLYL